MAGLVVENVGAIDPLLEPHRVGSAQTRVLGVPPMAGPVRRICLAYSGGLDTSVILRWLRDRYDAEIVAFCADLGQEEELDGLEKRSEEHTSELQSQ